MTDKANKLKDRYDSFALTGDENTTACDFHLRDIEIEFALGHIRDGDRVLDVGCGPGVALQRYATERRIDAVGIDYSENMIAFARKRAAEAAPGVAMEFRLASVDDLPFDDGGFDVVTSHRCLMALLDWERQQKAIIDIHRVLRPGGALVMMEGTFDGLERLNRYRRKFDLPEIAAGGDDRLPTLKFHEQALTEFCEKRFELAHVQRFGMYYFLTRIVQPLLVAPEQPRYDHPLNAVARKIARHLPDFDGIGHLVGFVWRKRPAADAERRGAR